MGAGVKGEKKGKKKIRCAVRRRVGCMAEWRTGEREAGKGRVMPTGEPGQGGSGGGGWGVALRTSEFPGLRAGRKGVREGGT